MGRRKKQVRSERVKITCHPVVKQYLRALIPKGIYGGSEGEIAGRWVEERIQRLIEAGSLDEIPTEPPTSD